MLQVAMNVLKFFGPYMRNYSRLTAISNRATITSMEIRKFSDQPESKDIASSTAPDNSKYQCPEYYSYNEFSYYDTDSMCVTKRLPQPSADFKDSTLAKK